MILFLPCHTVINTKDITSGQLVLDETKMPPMLTGMKLSMRNGQRLSLPAESAAIVARTLEGENEREIQAHQVLGGQIARPSLIPDFTKGTKR